MKTSDKIKQYKENISDCRRKINMYHDKIREERDKISQLTTDIQNLCKHEKWEKVLYNGPYTPTEYECVQCGETDRKPYTAID